MNENILYLQTFFTYKGINNDIQQHIIQHYLNISGFITPPSSPIKSPIKIPIKSNNESHRNIRPINIKKFKII
jgi:hypothetical protein